MNASLVRPAYPARVIITQNDAERALLSHCRRHLRACVRAGYDALPRGAVRGSTAKQDNWSCE
jgi:hypothetical protein